VQKVQLLKIVNPVVGVVFLVQALSGVFHNAIPWEVFHTWHGLLGYVVIALILVHIHLNWSWINANYLKKKTKIVKNKTDSKTISISKEAL
jgi:hypothetical protein